MFIWWRINKATQNMHHQAALLAQILPPSSGVRTKDNSLIPSVCFFRHIYLALFLLWSGVVSTFCFGLLLSRFSFSQNTNQIQLKYNHPIYGFFHVSFYTCFYQEQRNQSIIRFFSLIYSSLLLSSFGNLFRNDCGP